MAGISFSTRALLPGIVAIAFASPALAQTAGYYYTGDWPTFYSEPSSTYRAASAYPRPVESPKQTMGIGKINVRVPGNAQVTFNDLVSPAGSAKRWFESPNLRTDRGFSVKIRAEWIENSAKIEWSRTVVVHAGDQLNIDLSDR